MSITNISSQVDGGSSHQFSTYFSMALFSVFSVIGVLGNSLAVIVYWRKRDKLTSTIFILALAVIDLFTCAVLIPMTLYMEFVNFQIESDGLCKFYQFLQTSGIPFSAFMIAAIAVDRYFSICHPFLPVFNSFRAKVVITVLAFLSCVLGLIAGLMYGTNVTVDNVAIYNTTSLHVHNCSLNYEYFSAEVVEGYKYAHLSIYFMSVAVVSVLYLMIYCSVITRRQRRLKQRAQPPRSNTTLNNSPDDIELTTAIVRLSPPDRRKSGECIDAENNVRTKTTENENTGVSYNSTLLPCAKSPGEKNNSSPEKRNGSAANILASIFRRNGSRNTAKERLMVANLKTAAMLFVVSLVFIVTFLPAMLVILNVIPFDTTLFYMYFINNVSNPIIYAFMNKNFRDDLKLLLLCQRNGRLVRYR